MFRTSRMLLVLAVVVSIVAYAVPANCQMVNFNTQKYLNAIRNNTEGSLGYNFKVGPSSITVVALGRPLVGGSISQNHTVRLWKDGVTTAPVAEVTITPSSPVDAIGYMYEMLPTPVTLDAGAIYHLVSREYNGGDQWLEGYHLVAYHSYWATVRGYSMSTTSPDGYPNSINTNSYIGYGAPTFYIDIASLGTQVTGYAKDTQQNPVPNASVQVFAAGTTTPALRTVATAADGSYMFYITPGTYDVQVVKSGLYVTKKITNVVVDDTPVTLNFDDVQFGRAFYGVVKDSNDKPLVGASVVAVTGTDAPITVKTDAEGEYALTLAKSGTYNLSASYEGCQQVDVSSVTIGSSRVEQNFTLPLTSAITGYVEDADQNRLGGVTVVATGSAGSITTTTAADGTFTVYAYPGTFDIKVSKFQYATAIVNDLALDATPVEQNFTLSPGTYIYGIVRSDRQGNPPVVEAQVKAVGGEFTYETVTDSAGRYELDVQPGILYTVTASRSNHQSDSFSFQPELLSGTVHDFLLSFNNEWNLVEDFSWDHNPIGDWSYGWQYNNARGVFELYNQKMGLNVGGNIPNYDFWTTDNGHKWAGGIRKNPTTPEDWVMDESWDYFGGYDTETSIPAWYSEAGQVVMCPGGVSGNYDRIASVRWTAPKDMIINVEATWKSQLVPGYILASKTSKWDLTPYLLKNGTILTQPLMGGFIGRAVNGYTDSSDPLPISGRYPLATFGTPMSVNAGDTLDFTFKGNGWQPYLMSVDAYIKELTGPHAYVDSIAQIKELEDGTVVFLTTPMVLGTATYSSASIPSIFGHRYEEPTTVDESYFYVQSEDRLQGIKCVLMGGIISVPVGNKVTFTGIVDTDVFGEKYVRVGTIDSTLATDPPTPVGKLGKSLTSNGVLTRVWGRIVSTTVYENSPDYYHAASGIWYKRYYWAYVTINDGSKDIKVLLNVQHPYMSNYDAWIADLEPGDYVGVTGIASTIGDEAVIMPRYAGDFTIYQDVSP